MMGQVQKAMAEEGGNGPGMFRDRDMAKRKKRAGFLSRRVAVWESYGLLLPVGGAVLTAKPSQVVGAVEGREA